MKTIIIALSLVCCGQPIQGPAGPPGQDGAQGATGATGIAGVTGPSAGVASLAALSIHCGGTLQNTALSFSYDALVLKSGDVFASGAVYGSAFQIGASEFFAKAQNGSITARVLFAYDVDGAVNGGFWGLSLDRTSLVAVIVNTDSDAPGGSTTWTMTPDKCVVNNY